MPQKSFLWLTILLIQPLTIHLHSNSFDIVHLLSCPEWETASELKVPFLVKQKTTFIDFIPPWHLQCCVTCLLRKLTKTGPQELRFCNISCLWRIRLVHSFTATCHSATTVPCAALRLNFHVSETMNFHDSIFLWQKCTISQFFKIALCNIKFQSPL